MQFLRGDTRTERADATAPQQPRKAPLLPYAVGLLAFCGLVLGAFIAARDGRTGPARNAAGNASLSTLAPIMGHGRDTACEAVDKRLCEGRPDPGLEPTARRR